MLTKKQRPATADSFCRISLGHGRYADVDRADFEKLSRYRWFAKRSSTGIYAVRRVRSGKKEYLIRMHREIMQCPRDMVVHHRNHNGLDNQRENLVCMKPYHHHMEHLTHRWGTILKKTDIEKLAKMAGNPTGHYSSAVKKVQNQLINDREIA